MTMPQLTILAITYMRRSIISKVSIAYIDIDDVYLFSWIVYIAFINIFLYPFYYIAFINKNFSIHFILALQPVMLLIVISI